MDASGLITQAELARRLGCSPQLITKKIRPGGVLAEAVAEVDGRRLIDLRLARRLLADRADVSQPSQARRYTPDSIEVSTEDDRAYKAARARKAIAEAETAERACAADRGEFIHTRTAEQTYQTLAAQLQDALMTLPSKLAGELAAETDARAVSTRLTSALRGALAAFVAAAEDTTEAAEVADA